MSNQVQAMGTAAAMAGERTHTTITVPVTGDPEIDLMAGIVALMDQSNFKSTGFSIERVADWMKSRFSHIGPPGTQYAQTSRVDTLDQLNAQLQQEIEAKKILERVRHQKPLIDDRPDREAYHVTQKVSGCCSNHP